MRKVHIKTMVLGKMQTNCYIVKAPDAKEVVVIDPADQARLIEDYLKENDLECKKILLTHGHFDHITGAKELSSMTKAPIYAHEKEAKLLKDPYLNISIHLGDEISIEPDYLLKDDEKFQVGGLSWQVLYTPGHTEGGVCYYLQEEDIVFSGDTLFYESVGRTDFPTGNHQRLIDSIHNQLMVLKDDVMIYPGHGRYTTVGHERNYNQFIN